MRISITNIGATAISTESRLLIALDRQTNRTKEGEQGECPSRCFGLYRITPRPPNLVQNACEDGASGA